MTVRNRIFSLLAVAILLAAPAFAGNGSDGEWELGLFAGQAFLDDYTSAGTDYNLDDDLIFGARAGYWFTPLWSAELSWQTVATETGLGLLSEIDADLTATRVNLLANFNEGGKLRPFITAGIGEERIDINGALRADDVAANVGGGLRYQLGENFHLRWDARYVWADHGNAFLNTQENIETTLGAAWIFGGSGPADSDGDGVSDRKDKCPATPRGATVDASGCPMDSDGDGVLDGIDQCADTPKGHKVDSKGCSMDSDKDGVHDGPDQCPDTPKGAKVDSKGCPMDSDKDGVYDGIDRCADTPKGAKVDKNGCPMDSDGDGVADGIDRCADTPKGAKVDKTGCPMDSDKDGVYDGIDRCPGTAAGVKVDKNGCELLFEGEKQVLTLKNVLFEFNSADLTADSKKVLDGIAQSLTQSFTDVNVEIAGHTDSVGSAGYNKTLSQKRAESVMNHLASAGVDKARMTARGYGESEPVADNGNDAGRAMNRRVELRRAN